MSHYDTYSGYDRSDRLYDDRDPYGGAAVGYADRGVKRQRSPSPTYGSYRDDQYRSDWSPDRSRRTWQDLDPEEREREWQLYEREQEWDRYYANRGEARSGGEGYGYEDRYGRAPYDSYRSAGGATEDDRKPANGSTSSRPAPKTVASTHLTNPMDSPTILSFKKYTQLLRDLGNEPAAQSTGPESTQILFNKYQEYRKAFQKRAMEQFYESHKEEPWFKEKFGLSSNDVESRKARRKLGREGKKKIWLDELRSGALDQVNWDAETKANPDDENSIELPIMTDRFGKKSTIDDTESATLPPETNQILIRYIPCEISRQEVEDALKEKEGFLYLALGEPHPMKRYGRIGCAVFSPLSVDQMQDYAQSLSSTNIAGQKLTFELANRPAQVKLRIAPEYASTLPRLIHDLHQARQLVALLEREDRAELVLDDDATKVNASEEIDQRTFAIVAGNSEEEASLRPWLTEKLNEKADGKEPEGEEDDQISQKYLLVRKYLDLHIDLLRQVYNCDYYSSTLSDFPEELVRRVPYCLRYACYFPNKQTPSIADKAKLWVANVDLKHTLLMRPDDNQIGEYGGTDVQQMLMDLAAPYSREDETEKHRCIVKVNEVDECGKPFKAQIFVQKHVLNKHREWFTTLMADKIENAKFYNNYVRDPQRPMPTVQPERSNGVPPSALGSRLSGFDYGAGNVIRLGGSSSVPLRERLEEIPKSNTMRIGATITNPQPLDPRASMAPKSYQDLDAGVPSGSAEIELEY